MAQQTAVQKLMELDTFLKLMNVTIEWEEYLAMEKDQIINAHIDGEHQQGFQDEAEQYYNETYKQ